VVSPHQYFLGGKGGRCLRLTTLSPSCAVVTKSGNLNFLEPSGPLQACNGTDIRFYIRCLSCYRTVLSHHTHSLHFTRISLDILTLLYRTGLAANCAMPKRHFMVTQMVFPSSHGLLAKLSETRCYFEVATKFLDVRGDACVTL